MPSDSAPAVRCRGLTKGYGVGAARVRALRGIDLDVRFGERLILAGPSGCGKTTLIAILGALLDHDDGTCEILGQDVRRMGETERVRFRGASIGFVFQGFRLLPALSASENVAIPLLLRGAPHAHALRKARELLDRIGLGERTESLPAELSGGQQQRIAIARALIHAPGLVLCDEPTSQLDHASGQRVMQLLGALAKDDGRALVVVTHDPRILGFADRIARIDDGRILDISVSTEPPAARSMPRSRWSADSDRPPGRAFPDSTAP